MDISVVIPLFNEEESLPELEAWIRRVMEANGFSYEILFVNDGSTDRSMDVIKEIAAANPNVHAVSFSRNYGKSPALNVGFARAQGDVVITMDADLQDSPDEIPELYRMITEDGYDLVSGWKKKRYDPLSKTIPTKLFNATARKVSGIKNLHDFNCGLKAYKRQVVKHIEVYGDMHRYIPYLAKNAGYKKIGEKVVQHQARTYGHIRSARFADVHYRFLRCACGAYTQVCESLLRLLFVLCYEFGVFLSVACCHDHGVAVLPHGFCGRTDSTQFTRT